MSSNARWYDPALGRFISADTIVPEPGNPQSLNRFSYVLGNPLKYTDPSGHIEEDEYRDALNLTSRLCEDYGVCVIVDFGYVYHPDTGLVMGYLEGLWKMDELMILEEVVQRFEDKAGSAEAVKRAIGGVSILRVSKGGAAHWAPFGFITIGDYTFNQPGARAYWGSRIAIAHELAHYWDFKASSWKQRVSDVGDLSSRMHNAVQGEEGPTWYGRTNAFEEWAESVTGYLYPEYFAVLRAEGDPRENITVDHWAGFKQTLPGLGPFHKAFVARQFRALNVEVNK